MRETIYNNNEEGLVHFNTIWEGQSGPGAARHQRVKSWQLIVSDCDECVAALHRANRQIMAPLFTLSCKQSRKLPPALCALQSIKYICWFYFKKFPKQPLLFSDSWNFVDMAVKLNLFSFNTPEILMQGKPPPPHSTSAPWRSSSEYSRLCIVHQPPSSCCCCATTRWEDSDSTFWPLGMKISVSC